MPEDPESTFRPSRLGDDTPMITLAAQGDISAQSLMVEHVLACGNDGDVPVGIALGAAEAFARLAAESGLVAERRRLCGVLLIMSDNLWNGGFVERSRIYQGEALAIMSTLADEGDEYSATLLSQFAEHFSPQILKLADQIIRGGERPKPDEGCSGDNDPTKIH